MFDSWLETLPPALSEDNEKLIEALFETFVPPCVRFVHKSCKEVCSSYSRDCCGTAIVF